MSTAEVRRTIHDEALSGHADVISTLLNKVGNANLEDNIYGSILGAAVAKQQPSVVGIFLAAEGLEADKTDVGGKTPRMFAALLDDAEVFQDGHPA